MSELKPCIFCGSGISTFDETKHWTGQRYIVLKVYLRHWCEGEKTKIEVTRNSHQECMDAWNEMMKHDKTNFSTSQRSNQK